MKTKTVINNIDFFFHREDADEDKYKHKVGPVQRVFWSTFG